MHLEVAFGKSAAYRPVSDGLLVVQRVIDIGDLPVVALLAQKYQHADFVLQPKVTRTTVTCAKHERLACCDVVRPVLLLVVP